MCAPSKAGLDARQELLELEGLDQVVVGAHAQQADLVGKCALCQHHDHGHVGFLPKPGNELLTGKAREHEVAHDNVELERARRRFKAA